MQCRSDKISYLSWWHYLMIINLIQWFCKSWSNEEKLLYVVIIYALLVGEWNKTVLIILTWVWGWYKNMKALNGNLISKVVVIYDLAIDWMSFVDIVTILFQGAFSVNITSGCNQSKKAQRLK